MQSTLPPAEELPRHLAIVMDGNGRWAQRRGLPRLAGHRAGAEAVRRTVTAAAQRGIECLTLYAFSSDNWGRPADEVEGLMTLFRRFLKQETRRCIENGIRLTVIGRRDRLAPALVEAIQSAEAATRGGHSLLLRLAVDYSAREAILAAAAEADSLRPLNREQFSRRLLEVCHSPAGVPDVDLLIRTGGELRFSDFLLWESAYAELFFSPVMWPDFQEADLAAALADFAGRQRRFGLLPRDLPNPRPEVHQQVG